MDQSKRSDILAPNLALRSWQPIPHATYLRGVSHARKLSAEEFERLLRYGGETALAPSPALERLVEQGACAPADRGEKLTHWQRYHFCGNRYVPIINWAVTGTCNFNCRHCFDAVDNGPLLCEFSWEGSLRLIGEMDACGVQGVSLTGGEPMMHPRFMDICRAIERRGMSLDESAANGSLITSAMLDELKHVQKNRSLSCAWMGLGITTSFAAGRAPNARFSKPYSCCAAKDSRFAASAPFDWYMAMV